jgi:hypothetical protein
MSPRPCRRLVWLGCHQRKFYRTSLSRQSIYVYPFFSRGLLITSVDMNLYSKICYVLFCQRAVAVTYSTFSSSPLLPLLSRMSSPSSGHSQNRSSDYADRGNSEEIQMSAKGAEPRRQACML